MNNRAKGNAFEKKCKEYLEFLGWTVDRARAAVKFIGPGRFVSSTNDFFNCADLIAVHPGRPFTLFVQCTAGDDLAVRRDKLEAIRWNLSAQRVQLWAPVPGKRDVLRVFHMIGSSAWYESHLRMSQESDPRQLRYVADATGIAP